MISNVEQCTGNLQVGTTTRSRRRPILDVISLQMTCRLLNWRYGCTSLS